MTWQACVRDCSDFYPAAYVSHGRGHTLKNHAQAAAQSRPRRLFEFASFPLIDPSLDRRATLGLRPGPGRAPIRSAGNRVSNVALASRGYLIFVSLKATCLRAIGSYFLKESLSVAVLGFFF